MSKQLLDRLQIRRLHELGLDTSKAGMQYVANNNDIIFVVPKECGYHIKDVEDGYIICDALTLQDILDVLPKDISREGCTWSASLYIDYENNRIAYGNTDRDGFEIYHEIMIEKDLIDAAYSMLCWAIDNKFVETNKKRMRYENNQRRQTSA